MEETILAESTIPTPPPPSEPEITQNLEPPIIGREPQEINITLLRTDCTQHRVRLNKQAIKEYANHMMPPIDVIWDGEYYYVVDGHHRVEAVKCGNGKAICCVVREGTLKQAQWECLGANKDHGVRRTNEDKKNAVIFALRTFKNKKEYSDYKIGDQVGVDHKTVAKYRKLLNDGKLLPTGKFPKKVLSGTPENLLKIALAAAERNTNMKWKGEIVNGSLVLSLKLEMAAAA